MQARATGAKRATGGFKWHVFSVGLRTVLSATANLAAGWIGRTTGASGRAKPAAPPPSAAGLLISKRELLAAEARQARRQHRNVSRIYSAARETTHGILARGQQ